MEDAFIRTNLDGATKQQRPNTGDEMRRCECRRKLYEKETNFDLAKLTTNKSKQS